jgi:hypothetical protein
MDDQDLLERINDLAHEEHTLFERSAHGGLSDAEKKRLNSLTVALDQCWDLLHQRRARRHAGLNPDEAAVRDAAVVENYVE